PLHDCILQFRRHTRVVSSTLQHNKTILLELHTEFGSFLMEAGTLIDRPQNKPRRQTIPGRKKRKQRSSGTIEEAGQCSKAPRLDLESDKGLPWKNLELIFLLQEKDTSLLKKVDLAFDYVNSSSTKALDDIGQCLQVMDTSRTTVFVNKWVQSVLISSSKKVRLEENDPGFETSGSFLDYRCWKILHFCLEESKNFGVPLTCSKDFLRVIHSIAVDALHSVNVMPVCPNRIQLYDIVLDCISLVFSFHGGVANENLDLWILLLDKVLELVLNIVTDKLETEVGNFVMQLSCYLFDPFAMFLRVHPTRKTGFQNFIDKLLEPLLHLLHVLHSSACAVKGGWITKLSKLVEEVLAQGLFHPTHVDGFLSLQSTARYKNYSDAAVKDEKFVNKSYHRHLFDKLEKVVDKKNGLALVGLGELLHLFVTCATRHKGALVSGGSSSQLGHISHVRVVNSEKAPVCHSMDAELRNSIFDYFVQNLQYLLVDLDKSPRADGEVSVLLNASVTLRSINNLLDSCICDKLYLRTDDTSEGASRNFLRSAYSTLMAFAAKISHKQSSSPDSDGNSYRELLVSVRKEIIVAVHHLLNIEYEVIGDDLENLWSMVFSSMSCCYSLTDVLGQPLLSSEILRLGCRLIDLYSELRQVDSSIFALLRAVRHSLSCIKDGEAYAPSSSCSFYSGSLSMLFCSLDFRLSLSSAINAIPEGQASACICQLSSDIIESLEWMKSELQLADVDTTEKANQHSCYSQQNHLRAEILGKVLCEAYVIILDSITVTSGNSYLVAVSLKNLLEVISPSLSSSLISLKPDSSKELSDSVNGRNSNRLGGFDNESICWVLMVLFRLVLSCRSLFRQAIGLMPPNASKKMSKDLGDSFTPHSGRDWLNMKGSADKGFFSWMPQPSSTLLEVIYSVSDICIQGSVVLCSPLVYVLNAISLQRLVDLNRLIKSSEYMLQWNQAREEDADLSSYYKRNKKWRKCVVRMRNEAESLVTCMMGFFSSIVQDKLSSPSDDNSVIDYTLIQDLHKSDALSFATGSLDEKSLASALWWVICQNVDIWCSHAAKKDLKNFLTLVIRISIYSGQDHDDCHFGMLKMSKPLEKVTVHQTALDFLSNTISFEQQFVRRYMSSRFCKILQKLVSSIFDASGVNLSESPNWVEVISAFDSSPHTQIGALSCTKPTVEVDESCVKNINAEFTTCERLLSLLLWMPEEYFTLKSSSMYITYILNLERLLVGSLLGCKSESSSHSPHQIFQLFVTCRRVLRTLAVAANKENTSSSSQLLKSFPLPWLLKSLLAVIGSKGEFPEDIAIQAKVETFSLLDHTTNLLTTVSRGQFEERQLLNCYTEESGLSEGKVQLNTEEDVWRSVLFLAEALKQHLQEALAMIRDMPIDKKEEQLAGFRDLRKLSSILACFQGLLWGLISSVTDTKADNSNFKTKFSSYNAELMGVIKSCVDTFLNFTMFFIISLFLEDDPFAYQSANEFPSEKMVPSDSKNERKRGHLKKKLCPSFPDLEAFLTEVEKWKLCPKKPLLMQVFRGENAEAGFFLRQLFIACSAILRLNLQIDLKVSWTLFPTMLDISQFLLMEFSRSEMPNQFTYFWLDGTVKFIEELGSYFQQFDPSLSRDFYESLIGLHLKVIGKCISLQGKDAKLVSQEIGSRAKKLKTHNQSCFSLGMRRLGQLKGKLRISFISYIKRSSELHLLSSIQAVERALVGVQEGLMSNYEIVCGVSDEAEVSSVVAAGIDVLDLILEFVTGPKRLNMVKRHIESLVACLFNVILHLQGPCIFYVPPDSIEAYKKPDSGSVILMSIEVLTRISGKPTLFQMDAFQIAQSLRVPGSLFQYFLQLQVSEAPVKAAPLTKTCNRTVDQMFSVELYAACCRMLCNALKHHKSETRQCIALLEDSVSVLLHCLEIVNKNDVGERKFFVWEVREAVKCASSLRRVYEEVRQQKEAFGRCSYQEVDEALKPGVYALIDSCSPDDLQLLHTVFGEGPCRTTLATLQHDYKINFQFEGKV
ncbi:tRNA modification GTPase MnmE, partial [Striga asiatica]